MELIETLCRDYSNAQGELMLRVGELDNEVKAIARRKTPGILSALKKVRDDEQRLNAAITDNKPLFVKPKTRTFHGVKVGYQKAKGKIIFKDEEKLIAKIRRDYEGELGVLIKTKESVVKEALGQLPADQLKKLGVEVIETGDQVVIKLTDSDNQKMVNAILESLGIND